MINHFLALEHSMAHAEFSDPTDGTGGGALGAVDRSLHRIEKVTSLIAGYGIFALMMLGVWHVIGRKFFSAPVFGYIDVVEVMMAFLVFLAIGYTERLGGHIRMELLILFLKGRLLALFELVSVLLALVVVAVIGYFSWTHAMRAYTLGDSSIDAEIPLWPSKMVVPVALALLFLRLLISLWAYLRLLVDPTRAAIAVPELLSPEEQARREAEASAALVEAEMGAASAREAR
ncbi:MAG: TRAP transporter small permease [Hyphomicrobiaceae bacterium]|nr:TRAP transporter small permease [Hyphomicrobiaceae bacterium]